MTGFRTAPRPAERIDRNKRVAFEWDGRTFEGFEGDTIASALTASGQRTFSRSFKYHRPRGLLTATYHDPGIMVQVGADPNVRGAHRLITDGMIVGPQNVWPSLGFDAKAVTRYVSRFLTPGFYYKTFMSPRALWPMYAQVLGRFSAGGEVSNVARHERYDHRYAHPDVLVAGGGPAGMAAAIAAADAGATVILVEEERWLGGHLAFGDQADLNALSRLTSDVVRRKGIEVMTDAVVTGRYDHNLVAVVQRDVSGASERLVMARVKCLVIAVGTLERPLVFAGNDLPGVMLSTGARRLINLYGASPGQRAVVLTANQSGDSAIADLEDVGVKIVAVLDARQNQLVTAAEGKKGVRAVIDSSGGRHEADLLVTATGWTSPTALGNMAGDRPAYESVSGRFIPQTLPDNVVATGGILGDGDTDQLVDHGTATGREAAKRALQIGRCLQNQSPAGRGQTPVINEPIPIPELGHDQHPALYRSTTHGFVDFSEDVTSKDLAAAAGEGYDSLELAKRYTTVGMGPLQGKIEAVNAMALHAESTGARLDDASTTTWRPPYAPVRLGTLAGRRYEPVRYSRIQPWHDAQGAQPVVAGQWIRPEHYGSPHAEVKAVRERVGIIDVSPLGKIDLRGSDVTKLLEFVYVNRWSTLGIGKVRYGVMCTEDGVILDDGVTGRLGEAHYMMSTTSGGAGTVWNWLDEWLQTRFPEWDVKMTAVTDGYTSINVAGPDSRKLMNRITRIDLDNEQFGYMEVRTGAIAGVADCFLWRIGFTGELSYELHIPSQHGLYVWEALLETGSDLGVKPFGVEAQRILRLEKGHFIVGQDTDGLSQGFGMGADWAINLDKDDFAGKPELAWQQQRGSYPHLVAIQPIDGAVLPPEACQVLDRDRKVKGRITSSRMSPTLGRSICLGQVDAALDRPGQMLQIRLPDGRLTPAQVMEHRAHFDPEGLKVRG